MTLPAPHDDPARCGCPESRTPLSRRGLLQLAGTAGLVTAVTVGGARVATAATPAAGDVLVVLSMRGGMDGLNVVAPLGDPDYARARPSIAVPASVAHRVDAMFGLHPALAPVFPLWAAGRLAAVQAIGQSNPTRSHFAAMAALENAAPGTSVRTGWIDRMVGVTPGADLFEAAQLGRDTLPASMLGPQPKMAATRLSGVTLPRGGPTVAALRSGFSVLAKGPAGATVEATRRSLDAVEYAGALPPSSARVQDRGEASTGAAAPTSAYPAGRLGEGLRDVARLVKDPGSGIRVASIDYGSWDMHANMGRPDSGWMRDNLTELATALAAFAADLGPALDRVCLFTISEFGRKVTQNGSDGVDHGHGGLMLVMGGGIRGGKVYGRWPGLGTGPWTTVTCGPPPTTGP